MAQPKQKLTLIVIPETGKRTLTLQLSAVWLYLTLLLVLFSGVVSFVLWRTNLALRNQAMTLAKTNKLQQATLDEMEEKVQLTADKLDRLETLEQQIRELTGQEAPPVSRSGGESAAAPLSQAGRGGPGSTYEGEQPVPTLAALLPNEITEYILKRRETLNLPETQASSTYQPTAVPLAVANKALLKLDSQVALADRLLVTLPKGEEAVKERLDYLAHRPSGLPVSGGLFTDRFGWRWSPFGLGRQFHEGLDIAIGYGTTIVSTGDGVVTFAGWRDGGYGYAVVISHGYGFETIYAHMSAWNVKVGQTVKRGTPIGQVGTSGNSTGPHVHYEVHLDGAPVDPAKYL